MTQLNNRQTFKTFAISATFVLGLATVCSAQPAANTRSPSTSSKPRQEPTHVKLPGPGNFMYFKDIPSNFPVPIYRSNLVSTAFISPTKGSVAAEASIVTKDPPQTVFDWYKGQLTRDGWNVINPSPQMLGLSKYKKKFFFVMGAKEGQSLRITCVEGPKRVGTKLDVRWVAKQRI